MMRRLRRTLLTLSLLLALGLSGLWTFRGRLLRPAGIQPPTGQAGSTDLSLPEGFTASIFAEDLGGPRFMALGPGGLVLLAERGKDRVVALPDADGDGQAEAPIVLAEDLNRPSSLAVLRYLDAPDRAAVFVGETDKVRRIEIALSGPTATELEVLGETVVIDDLPPTGAHTTRTLLLAAGELYVSIGSSCNVCVEEDERRAAVMVYALDGSNGQIYARGLRNAVGLALNPWSGAIWASNNGRDLMGNDLPPETVYALAEGMDAGWPRCHAGRIPDPDWEGDAEVDPCEGVAAPLLEMQAHGAPLGIEFYDGRQHQAFPEAYRDDLYVALHGSWNRVPPTGYKVVRVPLEEGAVAGPAEDFATGWLKADGDSSGRPAGLLVTDDGALLVSDDKAGLIYRITGEDR